MKSRSDSDEGISERVRVAYQEKCNILLTSHQDSLRDPAAATPCASASLLAQQNFDSAQDDRLIVCFVVIVRSGRFVDRPHKIILLTRRKRAEQNQLAFFIPNRYFGLRFVIYDIKDQATAFSSHQILLV